MSVKQGRAGLTRRDFLRATAHLTGATLATAGLAACGSGSGDEKDGVKQVSFILDWIPKGQTAPFYIALEKGYWAKRGLAVQLQRGFGSGDTAVRIGRGEAQFGWAGVSAVMDAIAKGMPLREVAATTTTHPSAIFARKDVPLKTAQDLVGLTGADNATGENNAVMRAYCAKNDIAYDKDISWRFIKDAGIAQVVGGQSDMIIDWITNLPEWWLQKPPVEPNTLWIAKDLGIYGNGIITTEEVMEDDPDLARNFLGGALEGYQYTIENGAKGQQEAIKALFKYNPEIAAQPSAKELHLANLQLYLSLMLVKETGDHGIGYFVPEKVDRTLAFINEHLLDKPLKRDDAFGLDMVEDGEFKVDIEKGRAALQTVAGRKNPLLSQLT